MPTLSQDLVMNHVRLGAETATMHCAIYRLCNKLLTAANGL